MTDSPGPALIAALLLTANLGASVAVAVRVASRLADDRLDRALAATLLAIAEGVGVPLVLSMFGILSRVPVTIVHAIVFVAVFRSVPAGEPLARTNRGILSTLAGVSGAALVAFSLAPALSGLQTTHGETRHYHIANLTAWLQERTLWTMPFQNPGLPTATHPGNAEMFGLWLALPGHNDHAAYLMMIPFAFLAVLACSAIARELGGEPGWGALCCVALLATPHVFLTHSYAIVSDLPAATGLAAGVAYLLRARKDGGRTSVLLAGLALGLGAGSKYTVMLPIALVLAWSLVVLRPRPRALLLLPGLVLLAAPWFARNLVETGNPVFPQEVKIGDRNLFPGVESPYEQLSTTMAEHLLKGRTDVLRRWADLAANVWGPVLLLSAAGVVAAAVGHPRRRERLLVAALAIVCGGTYMVLPLSGGGPDGLAFLIGSNLRYALPALLLGAAVAASTLPTIARAALVLATAAYGLFRIAEGSSLRPELDIRPRVVLLAIAAAAIVAVVVWKPPDARRRATAFAVAGLALFGAWGFMWRQARVVGPTRLEAVVAREAGDDPVIVLGSVDLRSILGAELDRKLTTLTDGGAAGERAFKDVARLTAALEASRGDVLVVTTRAGTASVPAGWRPPPTWRRIEQIGSDAVYVRVRSG